MAATTSASSSSTSNTAAVSSHNLVKQIKSHEVAIAEPNNLPSSRAVYQRNGNLFFRSSVPKATIFEQNFTAQIWSQIRLELSDAHGRLVIVRDPRASDDSKHICVLICAQSFPLDCPSHLCAVYLTGQLDTAKAGLQKLNSA